MSATANWPYTNAATVYPRVYDDWNSTWTTGTPYLIDCTWTANNEVAVDANGNGMGYVILRRRTRLQNSDVR